MGPESSSGHAPARGRYAPLAGDTINFPEQQRYLGRNSGGQVLHDVEAEPSAKATPTTPTPALPQGRASCHAANGPKDFLSPRNQNTAGYRPRASFITCRAPRTTHYVPRTAFSSSLGRGSHRPLFRRWGVGGRFLMERKVKRSVSSAPTTPTPALPQGRVPDCAATGAKAFVATKQGAPRAASHGLQASFSPRTAHQVPPFLPPPWGRWLRSNRRGVRRSEGGGWGVGGGRRFVATQKVNAWLHQRQPPPPPRPSPRGLLIARQPDRSPDRLDKNKKMQVTSYAPIPTGHEPQAASGFPRALAAGFLASRTAKRASPSRLGR
ncbi:hypothetical protein Ocepr_2157 [Oceanithermus profundus DSM 14977]|uniref:Uncharacterized protein n=1 Tax=Oceanithermus profundus (strain DSM 14977 / NBRC 100410 / VKM B-2274 / 506) TaxID=670487 RepID=E4U5D3_OCEP5|nr:hypothetical protein Ocepr_2157 [Oceanithermus profundus DSM 14977]